MKSIMLMALLTQLIVQIPEKGASSVNFTLTGFDVVTASAVLKDGKIFDYNRLSDVESKFIVYGGVGLLDNDDKIIVSGYQTGKEIKLEDCSAASPEAEPIEIYNRYYRVTD